MEIVNEGSSYVLGLTFKDENGNGVTPANATYRIDDEESGNGVTGNNANHWVDISPSGNTYDLVVTANQNAFIGNNTQREERVVTLKFKFSADSKWQTEEYRYMLTRLENLLKT
jgi:hypothetical protein